jgi:hypothetical protein
MTMQISLPRAVGLIACVHAGCVEDVATTSRADHLHAGEPPLRLEALAPPCNQASAGDVLIHRWQRNASGDLPPTSASSIVGWSPASSAPDARDVVSADAAVFFYDDRAVSLCALVLIAQAEASADPTRFRLDEERGYYEHIHGLRLVIQADLRGNVSGYHYSHPDFLWLPRKR